MALWKGKQYLSASSQQAGVKFQNRLAKAGDSMHGVAGGVKKIQSSVAVHNHTSMEQSVARNSGHLHDDLVQHFAAFTIKCGFQTNRHPYHHLQDFHLLISRPWSLSTIEPINHQAYQPSSLLTIKPIDHQAYRPSSLLTIEPINHRAYQPLSLSTIEPINHRSYRPSSLSTIKPINH